MPRMIGADDDWNLYSSHRARLTEAILSAARSAGGRLCVLGAGPCNDIDLERLASTFSEIHLVDIAPGAVARAVARQPAEIRSRLFRHAPTDLSGLSSKRLSKWKRFAPMTRDIETATASSLQAIIAQLPGPFDVVASACVLTQMSFDLRTRLGEGHPMFGPIRLSLVAMHVNLLVGLTAPSGVALLVSDATSSNHYPLADLQADRDMRTVLSDVVKRGACYFAANPEVIGSFLSQLGELELLDPWLWTAGLGRTYLVYAFRLSRGGALGPR
jgi:hypothetical protein